MVYDITDKESFEEIKNYYCPKIRKLCKLNIPIILLGNKTDKENKRKIKTEEGIDLALKEKLKFKETSCQKNENVADAFEALIEMWNIENKNKNKGTFQKMRMSGIKSRGKSKSLYFDENINKTMDFSRRHSLCLNEEEENNNNKSFTLNKNKKSNKKKKCSC